MEEHEEDNKKQRREWWGNIKKIILDQMTMHEEDRFPVRIGISILDHSDTVRLM